MFYIYYICWFYYISLKYYKRNMHKTCFIDVLYIHMFYVLYMFCIYIHVYIYINMFYIYCICWFYYISLKYYKRNIHKICFIYIYIYIMFYTCFVYIYMYVYIYITCFKYIAFVGFIT